METLPEPFAKQPLQLPHRDAGETGQDLAGERRFEVGLHRREHPQQARVAHAEALAQVHPLRAQPLADLIVQEPVADPRREPGAVVAADQVEHQVEGGDAAGAGDPLALDLEQRADHLDVGIALLEGRHVLPVQRAAPAREQAGAGQQIGAAGNASQRHPAPGEPAQPREEGGIVELGRIAAGADEDAVGGDVA